MTEEEREQWRQALAARAAKQRTNRGPQRSQYRNATGVRWAPRDPQGMRNASRKGG